MTKYDQAICKLQANPHRTTTEQDINLCYGFLNQDRRSRQWITADTLSRLGYPVGEDIIGREREVVKETG